MIQKLKDLLGPNPFQIEPMNLERDYEDIDRLFDQEEWPFLRSDLEVSHAQPQSVALVARINGTIAGFFATHPFGPVGYLDMMITVPEFRSRGVTRHLYVAAMHALRKNGITAFVVHTTHDSAPLIKFLGFAPGQTFTLLRREPSRPVTKSTNPIPKGRLGKTNAQELVDLDSEIFHFRRPSWVNTLLSQPDVLFFGNVQADDLKASLCLRPRKGNAFCLDGANATSFTNLAPLLGDVLSGYGNHRLECFVRTGSELHRVLESNGFVVPDFFKSIGPLIEWRKGDTVAMGLTPQIQCLSWF